MPKNIGKLSKLRSLDASDNPISELARSIVELDASCVLNVEGDIDLRLPPYEIATQGILAIRCYFEDGSA